MKNLHTKVLIYPPTPSIFMAEHAPSMSMYDIIRALSLPPLLCARKPIFVDAFLSLSLPPMLSQSVPSLSALPFPPSLPPMGAITAL